MARYSGAVCRLCRREGSKLFLKASRCYTPKCPVQKRPKPPGEHGPSRRKATEYGMQMREKQKVKRVYGLLERQFRRFYRMASRAKGATGEMLLQLLERRLDNVIYRMGFAGSRAEARQFIRHGHFSVDGRKVSIPSYVTDEGQEIVVKSSSRGMNRFKELQEIGRGMRPPDWLEMDYDNMKGRIRRLPGREEIDLPIQEHLIVELYSR